MKSIIVTIVLSFLIKPIFPLVDYVVNYEYITKTLCVNKAKPQMNCNGKCHLMKELAKAAESEKPISSDKKQATQELEILFFQSIQPFEYVSSAFTLYQKVSDNYSDLYSYLNCRVFEHPPTVSC